MSKKLILAENALDSSTWIEHDVENVIEFLMSKFEKFPDNGRIYHKQVAENCDVTPSDEGSIEKLNSLEGPFYVVIYPGEPITIIVAVVAVLAVAAAVFLRPSIPTVALRNTQSESPNNSLSDRQNQPRPNGRIPDIYGTVRSTPDLLAVPYKIFSNHVEFEVAYMCIGRGEFDISDIRDDTTPLAQIAGASLEIYEPNTSPLSGDLPSLTIGSAITYPLVNAKRYSSINGQTLEPPSGSSYYSVPCKFKDPNIIEAQATTLNYYFDPETGEPDFYEVPTDLTQYFSAGGEITVNSGTVDGLEFDGTYFITSVTATEITLVSPELVNSDWSSLAGLTNGETSSFVNTTMTSSGSNFVGPVILDLENTSTIQVNVVALNGLYKDDGTNQYSTTIACELEITPVDASNVPTGATETFTFSVFGSATSRDLRATTYQATPTFTGRCSVRMRRTTAKDTAFSGTVVDEIKWRDVYAMADIAATDFGNVTTCFVLTEATEGALALKDRKLNMLVTRKIPERVSGSTFTGTNVATNRADEIISAICLDQYIGNRELNEIDFDSIYNTVAEIEAYFGTEVAAEFNYTFDNDNLSFEETISSIASAIHCNAYRQGSTIKLTFEKETEDSVLLFNHRNKLPATEKRTIRFGNQDDNDGVEYEYVDPTDDAIVTFYIPEDKSARNPKKIESIGVRSKLQAYFHAWRLWNKIRFQNVAVEFEATQEADLLVLSDRILVADNTRSGTQDGEIIEQNGLVLTLSQPVVQKVGETYTIFIQHTDGTVEGIGINFGSDPYQVQLQLAPKQALYLDPEGFARATYIIVGNSSEREQAFLLTEKEPLSNFTSNLRAINYSDRYYQNDKDFDNGIIDENGNVI